VAPDGQKHSDQDGLKCGSIAKDGWPANFSAGVAGFWRDGMIVAVDSFYSEKQAMTAGVTFQDWPDDQPIETMRKLSAIPAGYQPGNFYQREMPLILGLLKQLPALPACVVIDGYVTLDEAGRKGLGAHLFDEMGQAVPVIGVAKKSFRGSAHAQKIIRGKSTKPLFITAAGIELEPAASHIASMHGQFRIPTLLKLVDQLSRETPIE